MDMQVDAVLSEDPKEEEEKEVTKNCKTASQISMHPWMYEDKFANCLHEHVAILPTRESSCA